ncbi:hypothetical protein LCGC14_0803850 [marine sediment metagenome]|uniref:Uncharacterized protein n=1 Tax=marine sediment metagenome TaxID=412755 RepID=A0A0F9SW25_9ZZZZ
MTVNTNATTRVGILPIDIYFPTDDSKLFHEVINLRERDTATILNQKENAVYALVELLSSQVWFPGTTSPNERPGFRTTYETGVLTTGSNLIAHGLTITTFLFTDTFGFINDGTNHVPITNGDGGTGDSINVNIDPTNIDINITAGYNNFSGQITLEYVKTL